MDKPYLTMQQLSDLFGMSLKGLHNAVHHNRFPVPTYKLGKFRVADKHVVQAYFDKQRTKGLQAIGMQ